MGFIYYNQSHIDNHFYTQAQINSFLYGYDTAIQTISDNVDALSSGNTEFDVIKFFDEGLNSVEYTFSGVANRRSLATPTGTTEIDTTGSATTSSYVIFENSIQVHEIIFTDEPTFKFKNSTELKTILDISSTYTDADVLTLLANENNLIMKKIYIKDNFLPIINLNKTDDNGETIHNGLMYISTFGADPSLVFDVASSVPMNVAIRNTGDDKLVIGANLTTSYNNLKFLDDTGVVIIGAFI